MQMQIRRIVVRILCTGVVLAHGAHASAQGFSELSAGGALLQTYTTSLGWYGDAVHWFSPGVGLVGEGSGYYSVGGFYGAHPTIRWNTFLGGARFRLSPPRVGPTVFAQLLFGGTLESQTFRDRAIRYTNQTWYRTVQPGIGVRVPLNRQWAVRVRADLQLGEAGGEPFGGLVLGGGITRSIWH